MLKDAKGANREVLEYYPFKWMFTPAATAQEGVQFLREIGVDLEHVVTEAAIEKAYANMPNFEQLIEEDKVQLGGDVMVNDIQPMSFKMIPEWGEMKGLIINFPVYYPPLWNTFKQYFQACTHVTTHVRLPEGYMGATVLAWLEAQGIDLNKVQPIPGPQGDIWARDYSPVYGVDRYTGEAIAIKFRFAAFSKEYRDDYPAIVKNDEDFMWKEGYTTYLSEIMLDGGYILTDGNGTYVATRRILKDNAHIPNLYEKLVAWFGAERLIFVDEEPGDELGHINHFKFVSEDTIIVGKSNKEDSAIARYLEDLALLFDKKGYKVFRTPVPEGMDHPTLGYSTEGNEFCVSHLGLYANSLIMNGKVLLAVYEEPMFHEFNEQAIEAYKQAMPNHEIIPITTDVLGQSGGGINCTTKELPDFRAFGKTEQFR